MTSKQQTKKTPVTKKTTAKKKAAPKKAPRQTWRFYVVTIGIFLVAVTTVIVIAMFTQRVVANQTNQARLDRIKGIYSSLNLDDSYRTTNVSIFGDKRVYEWDKDRTYSSAIEYTHGDTVSNTVADLDAKIKATGFTFVDEPYPGSGSTQYHYKSKDGEYIRLTVTSKPYQDALQNASAMDRAPTKAVYDMDKNAGPSVVTIKVNLDDNNE